MFGPPMSADLDDDGDLEMIMGHYVSSVSYAAAYHHDGTIVTGFPITIATTSQLFYLGLGDITSDGFPELIAVDNHLGSGYRVHTLDISTGLPLTGWPVAQTNWPEGLPTIVDVNNDGFQDVCFVTNGGELFALSGDGSVIAGYPKMISGPSISGVSAGDIDGDGFYELVAATWDGFVYAWDTDGAVAADRCDWPMRGVDARNTGIYRGAGGTGITETPELTGAVLTIAGNPVLGSTVFTVNGSANSSIVLFDITGKLISEINCSASDQISWTPSDNIPDGVYFARLAGEPGSALKFLIIR